MTTTAVALIPRTGDMTEWTPQQQALMEFAGLTWVEGPEGNKQRVYAPRSVVEAFSAAVARTNLDPVAKQIYAVQMGGKWSIIVGIDGMRVVAQRTGEYLGQTPMQWTADGATWVDVWLSTDKPAAARVGVRRAGFAEPLISVVTWAEFGKTSGQWGKMPAHMLAIRCESHALRRAFPNDLSGLYTIEDIDGGDIPADAVVQTEDWITLVRATDDKKDLAELADRIRDAGEMTGDIRAVILAHAGTITKDSRPKDEQPPAEEQAAKALGTTTELTEAEYEAKSAAEYEAHLAAQKAGESGE